MSLVVVSQVKRSSYSSKNFVLRPNKTKPAKIVIFSGITKYANITMLLCL